LEQQSGLLTEPTSNVLLGQLAWCYRYLAGTEALETLLAAFRRADAEGAAPPIVCTGLLPAGYLPRPAFQYLLPAARRSLALQTLGHDGAAAAMLLSQQLETVRGQAWVRTATLAQAAAALSSARLFAAMLADSQPAPPYLERAVRTHPGISRLTGAVETGLLFDAEESHFTPDGQLTVWVGLADEYASDEWLARWERCFALLAAQGIGRRATAGHGTFRLIENLTPAALPTVSAAGPIDGFVTLGAWAPAPGDPPALAYTLETRHGKLGGLYGSSNHVWKYPVSWLRVGAVGRLRPGEELKPVYGRLLERVHQTRGEIVDFGYTLALGVHLEDEHGNLSA